MMCWLKRASRFRIILEMVSYCCLSWCHYSSSYSHIDPLPVHLRMLVDAQVKEYMTMTKREKNDLTWDIIRKVRASEGRFLKKDKAGWWYEASEEETREKVAKTFANTASKHPNGRRPATAAAYIPPAKRGRMDEQNSCFGFCK